MRKIIIRLIVISLILGLVFIGLYIYQIKSKHARITISESTDIPKSYIECTRQKSSYQDDIRCIFNFEFKKKFVRFLQ